MGRGRRKKVAVPVVLNKGLEEDDYCVRARRSSMKVNLSFVSDLSESIPESLQKTQECDNNDLMRSVEGDGLLNSLNKNTTLKSCANGDIVTPVGVSNITVINLNDNFPNKRPLSNKIKNNSLIVMNEKEQQLNKSCMELKDAIIHKTQKLFDKENELAIKTTEVLTAGCSLVLENVNKSNQENDKRSPSIRVDIGKNDQIVMAGDGKKKNPVQINSMPNHDSTKIKQKMSSANRDNIYMDSNESIVSTPKKLRTQNERDGKETYSKDPETILRIPVVRLFADDNDPNNSMSGLNSIINLNSHKRIDINNQQEDMNCISDKSNDSNVLNCSTSPILSQGTRRSRISCLSLKKNIKKNSTKSSSKILKNSINESFVNRVPLTCSSFIEKQMKETNVNGINQHSKGNIENKEDVSTDSKTINLDDSEETNITVDIDSSTNQLSMELTTISSHVPIKYRSFQKSIRKSLKLDNMIITQQGIHHNNELEENSIKEGEINNTNANNGLTKNQDLNNPDCQNNHSDDAAITSSSQDNLHANFINSIVQKENKKPNIIEVTSNTNNIKEIIDNNAMISQHISSCSIRSSMQVNTSLDSIRKSITTNIVPQQKCTTDKSFSQQTNLNLNNEKYDRNTRRLSCSNINKAKKTNINITSQQPVSNTIRSSMQVNTSLDSSPKSPVPKKLLNVSNILSMVEENSTDYDHRKTTNDSLTNQSLNIDNDLENVSLIERIKNIYGIKKKDKVNELSQSILNKRKKTSGVEYPNLALQNKPVELHNTNIDLIEKCDEVTKNKLIPKRTSRRLNHCTETESSRSKGNNIENVSSTTNESSIVEGTPYPISRSVLLKTMMKNKIAMNTIDLKTVNVSDNNDLSNELETSIPKKKKTVSSQKFQSSTRKKTPNPTLMDTIVLDSSDELSNKVDMDKEPVIIDESLNNTEVLQNRKPDNKIHYKQDNKKIVAKRKLYTLKQTSQLISFSPADIQDSPKPIEQIRNKVTKKKRILPHTKQKKKKSDDNIELSGTNELSDKEVLETVKKTKKKARKIISKKIVIKKMTNISILDRLMNNGESTQRNVEVSQRLNTRGSSKEFDFRNVRSHQKEIKSQKNLIVVTGLTKEEKDLVKSVIKSLGSASLELNVTPRTTHVISSGLRTINLLKGIIRGCWLLSLDWALKSLENGTWLDPSPFEMCHFAKAVKENRRDRKLFGKAYTPETFVTCGLIYVQNGTSPSAPVLKDLIKIAGGRITENADQAQIVIGKEGLKEIWVLDCITTGEVQPLDEYKRSK